MTKQDLIKKISEDADVTSKQAAAMLDSLLNTIMDSVAAGDRVQLTGFGTFESKSRAARPGINPRTGERVEVPAATLPAFKAGKEFKSKVNP